MGDQIDRICEDYERRVDEIIADYTKRVTDSSNRLVADYIQRITDSSNQMLADYQKNADRIFADHTKRQNTLTWCILILLLSDGIAALVVLFVLLYGDLGLTLIH